MSAQTILDWHTLRGATYFQKIITDGAGLSILFDTAVDSVLLDDVSVCYQNPSTSLTSQTYIALLDSLSQSGDILQLSCPSQGFFLTSSIRSFNIEKTGGNSLTLTYTYKSDTLILNDTLLYIDTVDFQGLGVIKFRDDDQIIFSKRFPAHSVQSVYIASLPDNKIVLTGIFYKDSIVFDNYHLHCIGCSQHQHDCEIFIAVLDSLGNVLNAKSFGGFYWDYVNDLLTDSEGNIYLSGTTYSDYMMVDSLVLNTSSFAGLAGDAFLLKLNGNLDLIWGKMLTGNNDDAGWHLARDNEDNIYMSGHFASTMLIMGSDTLWNNSGYSNPYLIKLSYEGTLDWSRVFTAQAASTFISEMGVDAGNNLWFSVRYKGALDILGNIFVPDGIYDNAIVQLSPEGEYKQSYILKNTSGYALIPLEDNRLFFAGNYFGDDSLVFLNMTIPSLGEDDDPHFYFTLQLPPVATDAPSQPAAGLRISPNPLRSGGLLNVDFTDGARDNIERIQVYDCLGRLAAQYNWRENSNSRQIPLVLQAGLYFIAVRSGKSQAVQKLIVTD